MAVLILLVGAFAFAAASCGGDDEGDGGATQPAGEETAGDNQVTALPSASCEAVEYEGDGEADVLIATDLPMQGSSRTQTVQMVEATRFVLEQRGWKAGGLDVAFQACDDSTAQAGKWDSGKCSQNAQAYASNADVLGVLGTFNSGCAAIEIPVLNQAPGGGVAMVSPANTYVCLTESGPACAGDEPDKYYPAGTRNYVRMVAHDAYQGAAVATFAQNLGIESVYVLNDKEAYGQGVAENFRNAAESLGIEIAGFAAWDPKASSYEALMNTIEGTGAQAVFLGGLICENGGQVIKDKVAVLGENVEDPSQGVVLLAPDGFTTQATIDEAGAASAGMFSSVAGVPADQLTGAGKEFVDAFLAQSGAEPPLEPYTAYAAQAAEVLLLAIDAAATDERGPIVEALFTTQVTDGILGDFELSEFGDPSVGPVTIYVAADSFGTQEVITPDPDLVEAAKGGGA
ncbi:MAG: branched-chain amino acid ABC transporter substrate-binding protein [Gaiellaceae bacterium]